MRSTASRAETYILSHESLHRVVSLSADLGLRIEQLVEDGEVVQHWRQTLNTRFPLDQKAETYLHTALSLAQRPLGRVACMSAAHLTSSLRSHHTDITTVPVRTSSALFERDGCSVDVTQAVFRDRSFLTVGILAATAADVLEAVEGLNLATYPNVHYGEMIGANIVLSRFSCGEPAADRGQPDKAASGIG